jgi:hypothetical protein
VLIRAGNCLLINTVISMRSIGTKAEVLLNVLVILTGLALGIVLTRQFLFDTAAPFRHGPEAGYELKGLDLKNNTSSRTLVLALRKGCIYCSESAPFYQRVTKIARTHNVKLVAVLPGRSQESQEYLAELGLVDIDIRQSSLRDIKVGGTPTLLLADGEGRVTDFWVGKLSTNVEEEVIARLKLNSE